MALVHGMVHGFVGCCCRSLENQQCRPHPTYTEQHYIILLLGNCTRSQTNETNTCLVCHGILFQEFLFLRVMFWEQDLVITFLYHYFMSFSVHPSKIRYGLQLYGKVRTKEEDPKFADFKSIQILQNDLLRFLRVV